MKAIRELFSRVLNGGYCAERDHDWINVPGTNGEVANCTKCPIVRLTPAPTAAPMPPAPDGWQLIDTAPKDGFHIQLYAPELQFVGFWADGCSKWCYVAPGCPTAPTQPTHWKPLGANPAGVQNTDGGRQ